MGFWLSLFIFAFIAVCLLIIFVILLQSGEGGGLSGLVGGSSPLTDTFGATGAEKTLKKWTVYLAIGFLILTLALTYLGAKQTKKTDILEELTREEAPLATPIGQTPVPLETQASQAIPTTSPQTLVIGSEQTMPVGQEQPDVPAAPAPGSPTP